MNKSEVPQFPCLVYHLYEIAESTYMSCKSGKNTDWNVNTIVVTYKRNLRKMQP